MWGLVSAFHLAAIKHLFPWKWLLCKYWEAAGYRGATIHIYSWSFIIILSQITALSFWILMLYLTWCAALEGKLTSRDLWLTWLWGTTCKRKQGARKEIYVERGPGEAFFGRTWLAFCLTQVCLSLHTCLNHFPYISTFTFPWNKCLLHAKRNFPFLGMPRKQERSMPRKISSNTDSTRSRESLWRLSVNCQIHPPCFPPKQAL